MTTARQEAIRLLEQVPDEKLDFVVQIMQGINGLVGKTETSGKNTADLGRFVLPPTERGQNADSYVRGLRDNDRF